MGRSEHPRSYGLPLPLGRLSPARRSAGKGPAKYGFFEQGQPVWSAELDFTLSAVAVSDAGLVVGYGRRGAERGMDTFIVAVLDRAGELLLEERTPFTMSRFIPVSSNPVARGLMPDFEHDRFFVRIADEDLNRGIQAWWAYQASTGERLETLEPELAMAEAAPDAPDTGLHLMDARSLGRTGLYLVHWRRTDLEDYSQGFYSSGAVFTLMRGDASIVWRLDLPGDYSVEGDKRATRALERTLRGEDMLLGTGIDGHFELRFVEAGQRVHLQAVPDEAEPGAWHVDELYREPFVTEPEAAEPGPLLPTEVELPVSSKVVLERAGAEGSALLQEMRAWDFDGQDGGFLLVRAEADGHFVREHLDRQGQRIEAHAIDPLPADPDGGFVNWEALGNDTWLITRTSYGEDESREFQAIADGSTGEWFELDGLADADISGVAFSIDQGALLPNGNLVVLGTYSFENSMTDALLSLDLESLTVYRRELPNRETE